MGRTPTGLLPTLASATSPSNSSKSFAHRVASRTDCCAKIERVIFEAHPDDDRDGALDFEELLEQRARGTDLRVTVRLRPWRRFPTGSAPSWRREKLVASYESQVAQKKKLVDAYTADRSKLVSAGSEKRAQRHTELAGAANTIRTKLRRFTASDRLSSPCRTR